MTPEEIESIVSRYAAELLDRGIEPKRIDTSRTFASCSENELLAHAAHLCNGVLRFVYDTKKYGKANRHLTAIQMCLSFANVYTLDDLLSHNRLT